MCGRYKQTSAYTDLAELFGLVLNGIADDLLVNIAPGMTVPVLCDGGFAPMRWGFTPGWAKADNGTDIINARSETLLEKPSFKQAFQQRRGILPANGFFEWDRSQKPSLPYDIHLPDNAAFGLAAIWDQWKDLGTGEIKESFCLITREATPAIAPVHHRMPVILRNISEYHRWLDGTTPLPQLQQLFNNPPQDLLLTPLPRDNKNDLPEDARQMALF